MNIVVTGASAGIGFEVVKKLSSNGHRVLAIARRKTELQKLQRECLLENPEDKVFIWDTDITGIDEKTITNYFTQIEFDQVDALLNNAGLLINKPFMELSKEDWTNIYNVNVFGVVNLVKLLHPYLLKSNHKHIVNISSMGGVGGTAKFVGLSAYSSSKGALGILTECLSEEFKLDSIKVNALALGAVQTEMLSEAFPDYQAPLLPKEMAEYVEWFVVNGCKYFNGKIIPVALSNP